MEESSRKEWLYYALLAVGVCFPATMAAARNSMLSPLAAYVGLYVILELVCRFQSKKERIITGAVFLVGYNLIFWNVMGSVFLTVPLVSIFGLCIYGVFCVSGHLMVKRSGFLTTLVFPALWTLVYFAATILRFPSLARVDIMFGVLPVLLQIERFIGGLGLSFGILWTVSILRYAAAKRDGWYGALIAALIFLMFLPGIILLYPNTSAEQSVRVAYTTGPYIGNFMDYTAISYEENEASMERAICNAAAQGAEILAFSEEAFEIEDLQQEAMLQKCSQLAAKHGIAVLLGLDITDTDGSEGGKSLNQLVFIDGKGQQLGSYCKSNLIPILESDYAPGEGSIPEHDLQINGKNLKIAYMICYDSNFPEYVDNISVDTDILFLPSWDWASVTELHAKLCRALAIENHVSIVKPTYDGRSIAVDPEGNILYTSTTDGTGFEQIQIVDMPIKSTIKVVEKLAPRDPYVLAIISTEILSTIFCLVLLLGSKVQNQKTKRTKWFNGIVACNMVGALCDALSWILDGCAKLNLLVFATTFISMEATFVLIGCFVSYLTAYIRESTNVSHVPKIVGWSYGIVGFILTWLMAVSGNLFTVQNGVYTEGFLFNLYVIGNVGAVLVGILIIYAYRKALSKTTGIIAVVYMLVPATSAVINLFIEEWSFVYSANTISILLIYVILQLERVDHLENETRLIRYHATHDELTGLGNRRAFRTRVDQLKEMGGNCGVIFSDINGLKYANDNFGHAEGDRLILRYTDILTGLFRKHEIYRISGDEFVCLLEDIGEELFEDRIEKLEAAMGKEYPPIACIGFAYGKKQNVDEMLDDGEIQMYAKKEIIHAIFPKLRRH